MNQQSLLRLIPDSVIVNTATLGPLGRSMFAPGTWGSLVGLIFYTLIMFHLAPVYNFILMVLLIYLGVLFCGEAEIRLRKQDPPEVILDEFIGMPLSFIAVGWIYEQYPVWLVAILGFLLFRFFDIVKPLGIKKLQDLPGGIGVMIDDLAAGLMACLCLHLGFFAFAYFT